MAAPFKIVLEKYRNEAISERDKGDKFERLMKSYLLTDPKYANRFEHVWLWNDFPGKKDMGGTDTGIDLVAREYTGDYWAIQCKFYKEDGNLSKGAIDGFITTSSRKFKDTETLKSVGFSKRLWIDTTGRPWGINAKKAMEGLTPTVMRLNLHDLANSSVDWANLDKGITGIRSREPKKDLFDHVIKAVDETNKYFKKHERGKLIMACGTGKTLTSLKIAEKETGGQGLVLFLVPSIALLGQTLREWYNQADEPIKAVCICSDKEVSRSKKKSTSDEIEDEPEDLAEPASTKVSEVLRQFELIKKMPKAGMTVVFSTYQSIQVIADAQEELLKNGFPEFDLIICDEAHRTTGVSLAGKEEAAFVKVHDADFLKSKKRLYMTATPRLFSDDAKSKAIENDAVLCSMDDEDKYGEVIYKISFSEAVDLKVLTDYKVLVLTLSEDFITPAVQHMVEDANHEIAADDASKLIGVINALSKNVLGDEGLLKGVDPKPMRRAVAFCQRIEHRRGQNSSKMTTSYLNELNEKYVDDLPEEKKEHMVRVSAEHVDGSMGAGERERLLSWLKEDTEDENECRILTNVRCLSEGVDVPALDSIIFLTPRSSQIDVVQSVGRVMRKSPGKNYGYIIIPVVVPSDVKAEDVLNNNERFKVVWQVLNALRSHDDRLLDEVAKLDINKTSEKILTIFPDSAEGGLNEDGTPSELGKTALKQFALDYNDLNGAIYAKMVEKVGDRKYWERWASEVAKIAERYIERITRLVDKNKKHQKAFDTFLTGLHQNINPSITKADAIEMLAQHLITQPVFEALFEGYSFAKKNAMSIAMQHMLDILEDKAFDKDTAVLDNFYASVRRSASGIKTNEGRQKVVVELYDKFFKTAFKKMVDRLGIVYTPVPVVDFIIHSVNDVLKQEFGRTLEDKNVHILDPFTGTGTFVTRLLQSGLISKEALPHKYKHELHANEIVLLAYYIAAVNIENAYHDAMGTEDYESFEGVVLTDTFQLGETKESEKLFSEMFPQNSARVQRQKAAPIRVIVGNPPYSVGQRNANDNAQNQSYTKLDGRIGKTYAAETTATNKNSLYNTYMKAFRWSTDRLGKDGGIISFVTNGAWLDDNSADGFRKVIEKEFSSIWVFNLRGNQRTQGEQSRREGGKIFGSGSRNTVAVTLLVKNPKHKAKKATIHYHDIGDYLNREDKLKVIAGFGTVANADMKWRTLQPNKEGDWISKRNDAFGTYIPIGDKKGDEKTKSFFVPFYSNGVKTNRDAWVYSFNRRNLNDRIRGMIAFYNSQVDSYQTAIVSNPKLKVEDFIDSDDHKISWSRAFRDNVLRNKKYAHDQHNVRFGSYRPFVKQFTYFSREVTNDPALIPKLFPTSEFKNLVICVCGVGVTKDFSSIITDVIPDLELIGKSQCFPLYWYEEAKTDGQVNMFDAADTAKYTKRDGVSDFILKRAQKQYSSKNITKEDVFYYVYGFLHSPTYRETFANDLKKMLPRLPLVDGYKDFRSFSKAGRQLAELHINYETVAPYKDVDVTGLDSGLYRVEPKMKFGKKETIVEGRKKTVDDLSVIRYNSRVVISNIPEKAYEYVINGKSAIHWIMERYAVSTDKKSGIKNDPNDWAKEAGNPRYILDLLLN